MVQGINYLDSIKDQLFSGIDIYSDPKLKKEDIVSERIEKLIFIMSKLLMLIYICKILYIDFPTDLFSSYFIMKLPFFIESFVNQLQYSITIK